MLPGVYQAKKKDNSIYYRSSITYNGRHISLGSYSTELMAHDIYVIAGHILCDSCKPEDYSHRDDYRALPFDKYIMLVNFRDNGVYFSNPIYLMKSFFYYYLSVDEVYTFDAEDLFYYANHRIQKRGGRVFVADYGNQLTLSGRYGIKPYSVIGRDHEFLNGDDHDFRYSNIRILSKYKGVWPVLSKKAPGKTLYRAKIHVNGNYTIGTYEKESEAAIAYNKAVDHLHSIGINKNYAQNYIDDLSAREYADVYTDISLAGLKKSLSKHIKTQ